MKPLIVKQIKLNYDVYYVQNKMKGNFGGCPYCGCSLYNIGKIGNKLQCDKIKIVRTSKSLAYFQQRQTNQKQPNFFFLRLKVSAFQNCLRLLIYFYQHVVDIQ